MAHEHVSEARRIGLELLERTARLDEPVGLRAETSRTDRMAMAFAVRARRLLRAAFALLDAGMPDASVPLLRVMVEYLIVGRWVMQGGDERAKSWALHDLRERRVTLRAVLESPRLAEESRSRLEKELAETEAAIRHYGGPGAPLSKREAKALGDGTPSLEEMAVEPGLGFMYSLAYRVMSQTDVHATGVAIDSVFEEQQPRDPGPLLRLVPRHGLQGFDLYAVGAHVLVDILATLNVQLPELGWGDLIAESTEAIAAAESARRSQLTAE